jgi:hypothetical protein
MASLVDTRLLGAYFDIGRMMASTRMGVNRVLVYMHSVPQGYMILNRAFGHIPVAAMTAGPSRRSAMVDSNPPETRRNLL